MRYQKYQPEKELQPFVDCYFVWEGKAADEMAIQTPPNCKAAIVFNYGDPSWAEHYMKDREPVPNAFACGQFTANYQRIVKGTIGMVGIAFKPTGLHNFYGIRMSQLVNSRMPLEHLIGSDASQLHLKIKDCKEAERIQQMEAFLVKGLPSAKGRLSIIDETVDYMDQMKGLVTVDEVAHHFRISRRYLEKKFLEKVGVSPKLYLRLKRFIILSLELAYRNNNDWQDLIEKAGLHDQSHLVKEFLQFNKVNPTEYYKTHKEMPRFLEK